MVESDVRDSSKEKDTEIFLPAKLKVVALENVYTSIYFLSIL